MYEVLQNKKVDVAPIISFQFVEIINLIKRRITTKILLRSPKQININISMHHSIFHEWYKTIKNFHTEFGRNMEVIWKANGQQDKFKVEFYHFGTLKYHLGQITKKDDINTFLERSFRSGCFGKVYVSEEKKFTFTYDVAKSKLYIVGHFEIYNRYGNICV